MKWKITVNPYHSEYFCILSHLLSNLAALAALAWFDRRFKNHWLD